MIYLKGFIRYSFFAAICGAALTLQSCYMLQIAPSFAAALFVSTSILAGYNVYWFVQLYAHTFKVNKWHIVLAILGAIVSIGILFHHPSFIMPATISVLLGMLYSMPPLVLKNGYSLKVFYFCKPLLLAFIWSFFTVYIVYTEHSDIVSIFLNRFLFMLVVCLLFEAKDISNTDLNPVYSRLPPGFLQKINYLLILLYFLDSLILHDKLIEYVSVIVLTIILAIAVWYQGKGRGYYFYYLFIDGIMLISAVLTYLTTVF